ncbi:hypothetical protein QEG73_07535 [Chitinophagaceae bacterium 26-R-25]|nr:hypothetical protein [Chitinophagaceae bacterium 26-R-25]
MISLEDFYKDTKSLIPEDINKEIGHFNVFKIDELNARLKKKPQAMPYNRRAYYKISMIRGHNKAEYADKVIEIEKTPCYLPHREFPIIMFHWMKTREVISASSPLIF